MENLLVTCILDHAIDGRIDQMDQVLCINRRDTKDVERFRALDKWAAQLDTISKTVFDKAC